MMTDAGRPSVLGLRTRLDDKVEDEVRVFAQDALPQFVHQTAGQVKDVGRHVLQIAAVLGDDGQDALLAQHHHTGRRQVSHDDRTGSAGRSWPSPGRRP